MDACSITRSGRGGGPGRPGSDLRQAGRGRSQKNRPSGASRLEDLIASNLLAEHARERGLPLRGTSGPGRAERPRSAPLEKELEPNLRPERPYPDSALRPLYERARDTFVHPRLVEIGVLAVYTGAEMEKEFRKEREQTAKELALFLKSHPAKTLDDFSALARDPNWAAGTLCYKHMLPGPTSRYRRRSAPKSASCAHPATQRRSWSTIDGGFIARYIGERPPENITFEQARGKLLGGILRALAPPAVSGLHDKLARLHRVEMHFDRLPRDEQGL
jgi:hypothetical protein